MSTAPMLSPTILSIVLIFLVILAILWIALPFAVFGIKERLDRMNKELADIKTILQREQVSTDTRGENG